MNRVLVINPGGKRNIDKEKELQNKILALFSEYNDTPMFAVQNCKFSFKKYKNDMMLSFPEKNTYFIINRNFFKGEV